MVNCSKRQNVGNNVVLEQLNRSQNGDFTEYFLTRCLHVKMKEKIIFVLKMSILVNFR